MQKIYELEPREAINVMGPEETKKCKVVPKKYNYIPDILPNNKRIEGETILELNKSEIARVMTLADVYLVGEDDSETLLNPENYYESLEEKSEAENEPSTGRVVQQSVEPKSAPAPQQAQANTTNNNTQPQQTAKTVTTKMESKTPVAQQSVEPKSAPAPQQAQANTTNNNTQPQQTAKK